MSIFLISKITDFTEKYTSTIKIKCHMLIFLLLLLVFLIKKGIKLTKIRNQSLVFLQPHKCYIVYFPYQNQIGQNCFCPPIKYAVTTDTEISLRIRSQFCVSFVLFTLCSPPPQMRH